MEKKFKIALCILVIALISVIAFAGVYTNDIVSYEMVLPKYVLDSELTGKRISFFEFSDESEINSDENLTEENIETVKRIFENRLNGSSANDYFIRIDKKEGSVLVELADNENTDTFLQYLLFKGDFTVSDTEDKTVLLNRSDVIDSTIEYDNSKTGEVTVYLCVRFNDNGTKKLQEISQNYLKTQNEDEEQKTVDIAVESTTISSMSFENVVEDGVLKIEVGSGKDNQTVYSYANQAGFIAYIINNGEVPFDYTVTTSEFVAGELSGNVLYMIIAVFCTAVLVIIIYMILKFKTDGILAGLSLISALAIMLLLLRYTKTTISLGSFFGIASLIIVEVYFILNILNSIKNNSSIDNIKNVTLKTYLQRIDVIIVFLVIAVVFTFMPEIKIFSIGMTLFYGIISFAIANLVFLRSLLISNHE